MGIALAIASTVTGALWCAAKATEPKGARVRHLRKLIEAEDYRRHPG